MRSFDATVTTVLAAFPTVTAVLHDALPVATRGDVHPVAFPVDALLVALPLHGVVATVTSLDHVVVDAGLGVAVGVVLVALYVVALRRRDDPEHAGDDAREKSPSSGRENHDP